MSAVDQTALAQMVGQVAELDHASYEGPLLGALVNPIYKGEATLAKLDCLGLDDFSSDRHRGILEAARDCREAGEPIDLPFIGGRLLKKGRVDLASYLEKLASEAVPPPEHFDRYVQRVCQNAQERRARETFFALGADPRPVAERVASARAKLDAIAAERSIPAQQRSVAFPEYVRSYEPADHVVHPLIQRGHLYSFTARTGHAKTAIATTLAMHLACGRQCGELAVTRGARVLILSGENDHDQKSRVIATAQEFGLDPGERLQVIAGSYPIASGLDAIRESDRLHGPYDLIVGDTSAAYFGGDDENDNPQLRAHAAYFRVLTLLPGRPAVVVNCHPVKNATRDNLLPRGGGAFLGEVDGNFTSWREGDRLTFHWAGKFRGQPFDPLTFVLKTVQLAGKTDAQGRPVFSVVAVPIGDAEAERLARQDRTDENRLLYEMLQAPEGSMADWARACAWVSDKGTPHKGKVHRLLKTLEQDKLVRPDRGQWSLTGQGTEEARKAAK